MTEKMKTLVGIFLFKMIMEFCDVIIIETNEHLLFGSF